MNILGIHIGYDSSVALVVDGESIGDVAEERFTRIKHYCGLPIKSIEYCLNAADASFKDIDIIAVPSKEQRPKLNFLFDLRGNKVERQTTPREILEYFRKKSPSINNELECGIRSI